MIEIVIGEAIAGFTTLIIGCLHFANQIHKREVEKNTPKPRHIVLKVPAKPEPKPPVEKDPCVVALEEERHFCQQRIINGNNLRKEAGQQYRDRIKEITTEIVEIHSKSIKK